MKIGDRVRFVDDVGEGVIKGFSRDKTIALVENELGITMNVPLNKCVLLHQKEDYGKIKNKQQNNPSSPNQKKNSRAGANTLEVDLHIEKLLHEKNDAIIPIEYQINVAKRILRENRKRKGINIVFIHGQGEGILRKALIKEIEECFPEYSWEDASFAKYGVGGAILVKN